MLFPFARWLEIKCDHPCTFVHMHTNLVYVHRSIIITAACSNVVWYTAATKSARRPGPKAHGEASFQSRAAATIDAVVVVVVVVVVTAVCFCLSRGKDFVNSNKAQETQEAEAEADAVDTRERFTR
jgi:hypothetical protein